MKLTSMQVASMDYVKELSLLKESLKTKCLDVGCGSNPSGDVNVDLRAHAKAEFFEMQPQNIPNFILAHAEFLPLRENSFESVYSRDVIEHCEHPVSMLKEMIRVSKKNIELMCPHRFGKHAKTPFHIHHLNVQWLENILDKFRRKGRIQSYAISTDSRGFPHPYLSILILPNHIIVKILKT